MPCTIPALIAALEVAFGSMPSGETLVVTEAVCGCNCVRTRSAQLRCYAAEEEEAERQYEEVRQLLEACRELKQE